MNNLLALPMYALHPPATRALMQAVVTLLAQHDTDAQPVWPDDLLAHWRDERLLLSQTCGYPLVSQLPAVQLVGTFHYQALGCSGRDYRSWLVARDKQATLADFNGQRAVANSPDSQSGYNALRFVAARQGVTFSQLLLSGGHRQSLAALRDSQADIAAIDCVSWALLARYVPDELRGLHIIGETPAAPGLPLITAASTSAARLATLRTALHQLVSDPAWRGVCDDNLISGFSPVQRDDYQDVLAWEQQAAALGVTRL
ncbi:MULTISPECIES: phosphate/phosphite/phosphonate ABC transporter substrate-binding protein [Pantoea]|uniref:phosphate/phosphite/phosphonate ABC transporter substrate-binding protein n=1 Tax=Pantoea TaxID=53335 RepID=UPI0019112795|nr:PhnD/SsuA/transferrin family substrate-binding protein [Pantoea sp. S62]MBK5015955.1 PhnD/SsuA/transferrin family substrate-binding protein [Pantoea sp. S62]